MRGLEYLHISCPHYKCVHQPVDLRPLEFFGHQINIRLPQLPDIHFFWPHRYTLCCCMTYAVDLEVDSSPKEWIEFSILYEINLSSSCQTSAEVMFCLSKQVFTGAQGERRTFPLLAHIQTPSLHVPPFLAKSPTNHFTDVYIARPKATLDQELFLIHYSISSLYSHLCPQ